MYSSYIINVYSFHKKSHLKQEKRQRHKEERHNLTNEEQQQKIKANAKPISILIQNLMVLGI